MLAAASCSGAMPRRAAALDPPSPDDRPNFVFMLGDDVGYGQQQQALSERLLALICLR